MSDEEGMQHIICTAYKVVLFAAVRGSAFADEVCGLHNRAS